ncbi:MAG: sulfatase [Phycisphaeraceae bacterium]
MSRSKPFFFALVVFILMPFVPARAADRPNIVLFIADDMLWSDAGCYGSDDAKTPNLDRLATQGMAFTRCFTSTAMCAPTRQQLYTGVWPVRNGAYPNHSKVKPDTRSLGHHFADLGYRVAISGKKHYGPAKAFPFETLAGGKHHDSGKDAKKDLDLDAIRGFITRDREVPYVLICATNQPHAPWNRGDASAFDPAKLELPPFFADTPETRRAYAAYLAEVTYMDALLGEVMDAVDNAGQRDNTIFVFTSEQGIGLPFGKWTCYDAGLRTALVVRWPGKVEPGSRTDAMVQYIDFVPTLIDAVGGDPATIDTGLGGAPDGGTGFDGKSFLPVLEGEIDTFRDVTFGVHTTRGIIDGSDCYPIRSARDQRYKLILNLNHTTAFRNIAQRGPVWDSWLDAAKAGDANAAKLVERYRHRPAVELYDLEQDPFEMNNRAGDPALAEVRKRLHEQLAAWMKQQGDEGVATEMVVKPR